METRQRDTIARIRPLIEERGYDAVSVAAMAAAVGVSKATFYRIFPTKEHVREALRAAGVSPERLGARDGREALLDAAMDVFAAEGYTNATVDAITQAAGMSKAGFYWHFAGKEAIFVAVIARYAPFAAIGQVIATGEAAGDDPRTVLIGVLTALVAALTPRFALFRTIFVEAIQNAEVGAIFLREVLGVAMPLVGGYLTRQMAAGRIRQMPVVLALQSLIGPLFFNLLTREMFTRQGMALPPIDVAVAQIVETFVDGVSAKPVDRA